jgi:hypothetical protein
LINIVNQPTIDCIDYKSERSALDKSQASDTPYFGVKQDEAWFNEVREDDPDNMAQLLI